MTGIINDEGKQNKKIEAYNQEVLNWNFKREQLNEFLRLLTERNSHIQGQTPLMDFHQDCKIPPRNEVVIDHERIRILEHIAFHVGFPHQKRLYPLVDEGTSNSCNEGVFFSLTPRDIVYFSEFDDIPLSMVYFLDTDNAKGLRVQVKYDSDVISRYDLDAISAIELTDKNNLRVMHRRLNKKWIRQNTIPFDIKRLKEFRDKGYDWIVTPNPIEVKY